MILRCLHIFYGGSKQNLHHWHVYSRLHLSNRVEIGKMWVAIQYVLFSVVACSMLRRRNGVGERNGNGRRHELWAKIPVETFPIKKRINTELFIHGKEKLYIQKSKGGIGSRNIDLLEEGRILAGNKYAGVRTAAACSGKLTITWKGS